MTLALARRLSTSLLLAVAASCASPRPAPLAGGMALPFVENDFAGASARARAENLPLFVEVWAPW